MKPVKPCPFRHRETGKYEIISVSRPFSVEFCVECQKCGARGPVAETPIKARNAWNRGRRPEGVTNA